MIPIDDTPSTHNVELSTVLDKGFHFGQFRPTIRAVSELAGLLGEDES